MNAPQAPRTSSASRPSEPGIGRQGRGSPAGPFTRRLLLWWWLLGLIVQFAGAGVVVIFMKIALPPSAETWLPLVAGGYVSAHWAVFGCLGAALSLPRPASVSARLGFVPVDLSGIAIVSLGMLGVAFGALALLEGFELTDVGTVGALRTMLRESSGIRRTLFALMLTVAPAFGEEIFFRGFLLRGLDASGPRGFALFASSLLFAVTHFDLVQGVFAFFMGLFVGWAVLKTGSLWTGIVAHAVNNGTATALVFVGSTVEPAVLGAISLPMVAFSALLLARRTDPVAAPVDRDAEASG